MVTVSKFHTENTVSYLDVDTFNIWKDGVHLNRTSRRKLLDRKIEPDRKGDLNEIIRGIACQSDPARDIEQDAAVKD